MMRKSLFLITACLLLGGCLGSLLPKSEPTRLFALPPAAESMLNAPQQPAALLVVDEPNPVALLESDLILVTLARGEIQRLPASRWVAQPARLVQDGLVQRLRASGVAGSVDARALRFRSSLRLAGELRALQYDASQRTARLELHLHLLCSRQARSLGQRGIVVEQTPASADPAAIVAALGLALDQAALELAGWIGSYGPEPCADAAAGHSQESAKSKEPA